MPSAISKVTVGGQESLPVDRALLWGMTNTQRLEKIGAEHAHSPVGQIHPVSFCEIVHNLLLSNLYVFSQLLRYSCSEIFLVSIFVPD